MKKTFLKKELSKMNERDIKMFADTKSRRHRMILKDAVLVRSRALTQMTLLAATIAPMAAATAAGGAAATPLAVVEATPPGASLLVYKADNVASPGTAAAVFETTKDGVKYRELAIFNVVEGRITLAVRNSKVVACSKCGEMRDDPFEFTDSLDVKEDEVELDQFHGGPSQSHTYIKLVREPGTNQWIVGSTHRSVYFFGNGTAYKEKLPQPASGLARDLDAEWSPLRWNGIAIDHIKKLPIYIQDTYSKSEFDKFKRQECSGPGACTIAIRQNDGCMALAKDDRAGYFHASSPSAQERQTTEQSALAKCSVEGAGDCSVIYSKCFSVFSEIDGDRSR